MRNVQFILLSNLFVLVMGCTGNCPQKYAVHYREEVKVEIDGKLNSGEWNNTQQINFTFPWQDRTPPVTEFYAEVDTKHFYFAFRAEDNDIVMIDSSGESEVANGDRVEIFFAKSQDLKEYYCLEIGPGGSVLDYKASFYRKFDDSWNFPGLVVQTSINKDEYIVEGSIPIEELKDLGIYNLEKASPCFLIGLYRAEFSHTKSKDPKSEWISWVRPDTKDPDFHVPSSFGCFCFKPDEFKK